MTLPLQINPVLQIFYFNAYFSPQQFPLPLTRYACGTKEKFILCSGLITYLIFFKYVPSCAPVLPLPVSPHFQFPRGCCLFLYLNDFHTESVSSLKLTLERPRDSLSK